MATETKETFRWPPLESNPEVFTDYMRGVGLTAEWVINELYGFDEDLLGMLPQPVMAVIANVERLAKADDRQRGDAALVKPGLFYMKQHEARTEALPQLLIVLTAITVQGITYIFATQPIMIVSAALSATMAALSPAETWTSALAPAPRRVYAGVATSRVVLAGLVAYSLADLALRVAVSVATRDGVRVPGGEALDVGS